MNYHLQSINQLVNENKQLLHQPHSLESIHADLEHLRANVSIENNINVLNQQLNDLLGDLKHKLNQQKSHMVTNPIEEDEFEEVYDDESKNHEKSLQRDSAQDVINQLNGFLGSIQLHPEDKRTFQDILNNSNELLYNLPEGGATDKYFRDYLSSLEPCIGSYNAQ